MEAPVFVKCEPGWASDGEESSNVEQLPSVKYEEMKVEPSIEEGDSLFVKEEHLVEDVKEEPDYEDYDSAGQLPSQMQPLLHTATDDESTIVTPDESHMKPMCSVLCNPDSTHSEIDVSNVVKEEQEKWTCDCCSKSFRTELLLQEHILLLGQDAQVSTSGIIPGESVSGGENVSSCESCGKMLVCQDLREYKDTNLFLCVPCHSRVTTNCADVYVCKHCGDKFQYRGSLARHLHIHAKAKQFVCLHCKSTFSDFVHLYRHEKMHTTKGTYICNFCDEVCNCEDSLKAHMETHTGANPYTCRACAKSFSARWVLRRHVASHNKEKSVCFTCNKSFLRNSDLLKHSATHTGDKAFTCSHCSRAFAKKCSLEMHVATHTTEKLHVCSTCAETFSSKSALYKHMEVHAV